MKLLRLPPQGLIGRAILVVLCAVLIEFLGSSILYERVELHASRTEQTRRLAEQLVTAARVLDSAALADRADLARTLASGKAEVSWMGLPTLPSEPQGAVLRRMAAAMEAWEPALRTGGLRLSIGKPQNVIGPSRISAALPLRDGTWVQVSSELHSSFWAMLLGGLSSAAILCVGILASAILLLRSMGAPLRKLAHAAETVGQGRAVYVPEEGAPDLRHVARAFNSMQDRIADLLAARTHALAAVSHDLRTPLSRLRLRAGLVAERDTRAALEHDVDEMTAMLDSLLAYLGGRHESEPARLADVAAICLTLVDGVSDAGGVATYAGPDQLIAPVRPTSLKRALDNLIQNALVYAGRADVTLERRGELLIFCVEDDGPGIPEDQFDRVVEAFERLDDARGRNTKGLGLGLSIVQRIAAMDGGALRLTNRPQGGLRAELMLPAPG